MYLLQLRHSRHNRTLLQSCPHRLFHHLVDLLLVVELDFMLLRVNVDVYPVRIDADVQNVERMHASWKQCFVGGGNGMTQ